MHIAIIGAGLAGLMAAYDFQSRPDIQVTLYEKSRGLAGRAATRWYDRPAGRVYVDHGAQYLRDEAGLSPALHRLLQEVLPRAELADIGRPVWTFNAAGQIIEGDHAQNIAPKWSYARGFATLGKLIADAGNLMVKTQLRIDHLQALSGSSSGFGLIDPDGQTVGEADQVLIAIPSGQAADLLTASKLSPTDQTTGESLAELLRTAVYRRCWSVTLGYEQPAVRERLDHLPYYALINTDRQHDIAWLAFEHNKPGHVPDGQAVIIAQMANGYTARNWETPPVTVIEQVAAQVADLLGDDLRLPDWSDTQRWRYSQPDKTLDSGAVNGRIPGIWFAGDYLSGGRVHLAAQSGATVAGLIH
jgi:hypothetical protein